MALATVAGFPKALDSSTRHQGSFDLVIVGGLGHVGLPMGLVFANQGLHVCLYDTDRHKAALVNEGKMPFIEYGAEPILAAVLHKTLHLSSSISVVSRARFVMIAVGTPVDEYLNPDLRSLLEVINNLKHHLRPEQTMIIRSTVYPGTCRRILQLLSEQGGTWHVAY